MMSDWSKVGEGETLCITESTTILTSNVVTHMHHLLTVHFSPQFFPHSFKCSHLQLSYLVLLKNCVFFYFSILFSVSAPLNFPFLALSFCGYDVLFSWNDMCKWMHYCGLFFHLCFLCKYCIDSSPTCHHISGVKDLADGLKVLHPLWSCSRHSHLHLLPCPAYEHCDQGQWVKFGKVVENSVRKCEKKLAKKQPSFSSFSGFG